jgi:hypothetical protein
MVWGSIWLQGTLITLVSLAEIFWLDWWLVFGGFEFGGLVVCVLDKKLGKIQ